MYYTKALLAFLQLTVAAHPHLFFYTIPNVPLDLKKYLILCHLLKVRQSRNDFFQADVSSKKQRNEFYFTAMEPQVDLFSFIIWRKLKTPKKTFPN